MVDPVRCRPYRVRVRYAECDAWGELQALHWVSYFDSAVADAFGQLGVDWRRATHPDGALRLAELQLQVDRAAGYDDEIDVVVESLALAGGQLVATATATRIGSAGVSATATLGFAPRAGRDGRPRPPPAEVDAAVARFPT